MAGAVGNLARRARVLLLGAPGEPRSQAFFRLGMLAVLLLGIAVRLVGQIGSPSSLWMDEASWAERLIERSVFGFKFRPIAFMWAEKALVAWFGPTEFWLRFVPNVAGILALLLMPYVASRLFKHPLVRLAITLLFALHPALIDLSKEFKPYSSEAFVHLLLIALYLRTRETQDKRWFYALLSVLPVSFLWAYNIAFAYPGVLLVALFEGRRLWGTRGVVLAICSGAACLLVLGGTYMTLLRGIASDRTERYWSNKYDVFYGGQRPTPQRLRAPSPPPPVDDDSKSEEGEEEDEFASPVSSKDAPQTRVEWTTEKYLDIAALPGLRRDIWQVPKGIKPAAFRELATIDRLFWIGLHFLGLIWLFARRRYCELLLLAVPLYLTMVLNGFGQWPLGAFRTNLFMCVHAILIPGFALEAWCGESRVRCWTMAVALASITLIPGFALGFDWHREKHVWTRQHEQRKILEHLHARRLENLRERPDRPPERLLLDPQTFVSQDFYLNVEPDTRARYRTFFKKNFKQQELWGFTKRIKRDLRRLLQTEKQPIWLVVSKPRDMAPVRDQVRSTARIVSEEYIGKGHMILRVAPKRISHD